MLSSKKCLRGALLGVVLAARAMPASASGQLPLMVMPERDFASFSACLAHIEDILAAALGFADPMPRAVEGGTLQHLLRTEGVIKTGATASLDLHYGTETRVPLPDLGQVRTNYSYEERNLVCTGPVLAEQVLQGYYLEGYAPLP